MAAGNRLAAHCEVCRHFVWLDMRGLAAKLGDDHPASHQALVPKMRCAVCGTKGKASLRIHLPEGEGGTGRAHAWG